MLNFKEFILNDLNEYQKNVGSQIDEYFNNIKRLSNTYDDISDAIGNIHCSKGELLDFYCEEGKKTIEESYSRYVKNKTTFNESIKERIIVAKKDNDAELLSMLNSLIYLNKN